MSWFMNSLKGASFPQISISVCKLCRVAVGSGRKRSELKSPELLEDHGSPAWLKACRLRRQLGPSASTERQATCFHRLLRGSTSVGVSKVLINYYYFNCVGVYCSEERQGIVITGLFVYLIREFLHIIFVRCALFGLVVSVLEFPRCICAWNY
jgi:hypothetical protein